MKKKDFITTLKLLTGRYATWEIWEDFVKMAAISLANMVMFRKDREEQYFAIIKKYSKEELDLFSELLAVTIEALKNNPEQDFLGSLYMELGLGSHWSGQFFTPYHVCECMAEITFGNPLDELKDKPYITVNDPCCGGGALLIAAANVFRKRCEKDMPGENWRKYLLISGQDIDCIVASMCYIQLSILGCAAYIKVGNSLTEPIAEDDDTTDYWFTPAFLPLMGNTHKKGVEKNDRALVQ